MVTRRCQIGSQEFSGHHHHLMSGRRRHAPPPPPARIDTSGVLLSLSLSGASHRRTDRLGTERFTLSYQGHAFTSTYTLFLLRQYLTHPTKELRP